MAFKPLLYIPPFLSFKIFKDISVNYAPEDISIEVTNVCNFKCSFCPQSDPNHHQIVPKSFLSPENAEILLKKLREGGVKTNVIHWTLDGEPFLNRNFHLICGKAIEQGFTNQIFSTNGSVSTLERIMSLPSTADTKYTLCIDFCADPQIFEKCRGTPGSWIKVHKYINDILKDSSLPHIHFSLMDISGFEIADSHTRLIQYKKLMNLFPKSPRISFGQRVFHNATGFLSNLKKAKSKAPHVCPHPWFSLVVSSNGDVVSCSRDLQHKTVLGNLFQQDLKELWNGNKYQNFRHNHLQKDLSSIASCRNCDLPYDTIKASLTHMIKTAVGRLQLFSK